MRCTRFDTIVKAVSDCWRARRTFRRSPETLLKRVEQALLGFERQDLLRQQAAIERAVEVGIHHSRPLHGAGADRVHADALLRVFDSRGLGEADYRMFRSAVGTLPDVAVQAVDRGEIDVWNYCASYQNIFSENYLSMIESVDLMMLKDTKTKSYIAFENGILEVTKDAIKLVDYIDVDGYVWKSQIIQRDFIQSDNLENEYKYIFKLSGRYYLNNNFNYNHIIMRYLYNNQLFKLIIQILRYTYYSSFEMYIDELFLSNPVI